MQKRRLDANNIITSHANSVSRCFPSHRQGNEPTPLFPVWRNDGRRNVHRYALRLCGFSISGTALYSMWGIDRSIYSAQPNESPKRGCPQGTDEFAQEPAEVKAGWRPFRSNNPKEMVNPMTTGESQIVAARCFLDRSSTSNG